MSFFRVADVTVPQDVYNDAIKRLEARKVDLDKLVSPDNNHMSSRNRDDGKEVCLSGGGHYIPFSASLAFRDRLGAASSSHDLGPAGRAATTIPGDHSLLI
jgi:hypothetical protein